MAKWTKHPAVWVGGTLAALIYLCNRGKLPIPWLCMGVEGVKDPRSWNKSLEFGPWLFGGGRNAVGKQLTYLQEKPFSYVNSFDPLEIKTLGTANGPIGKIIEVKSVNGDLYALLENSPIGSGVWSPIIPGYAEPL